LPKLVGKLVGLTTDTGVTDLKEAVVLGTLELDAELALESLEPELVSKVGTWDVETS
jgi:hypothetical protein